MEKKLRLWRRELIDHVDPNLLAIINLETKQTRVERMSGNLSLKSHHPAKSPTETRKSHEWKVKAQILTEKTKTTNQTQVLKTSRLEIDRAVWSKLSFVYIKWGNRESFSLEGWWLKRLWTSRHCVWYTTVQLVGNTTGHTVFGVPYQNSDVSDFLQGSLKRLWETHDQTNKVKVNQSLGFRLLSNKDCTSYNI